jgi:ABC-2 type transport system ATP-binding protein
MTAALEAHDLHKTYGKAVALRDCDATFPAGKVIGLVGPNGAGKTTLLQLAIGLRYPTAGSIEVLGRTPARDTLGVLAHVGYVGQDRPLYLDLTVEETLHLGSRLNAGWDDAYARGRISHLRIPLDRKVRALSTGQRAQVALTLALGKRPALLLLDEPVANLDPVARLEFLEELMGAAADGPTVVLASNAMADIERVCEHVVILVNGRVRVAGDVEEIERDHVVVVAPRTQVEETATAMGELIDMREAERQTIQLRRGPLPAPGTTDGTTARHATVEEIVIGYLRAAGKEVR